MKYTIYISGAIALLAMASAAYAQGYDASGNFQLSPEPQPSMSYGYVSTRNVDREYEVEKLQRDLNDEHYEMQQELIQQSIIHAESE